MRQITNKRILGHPALEKLSDERAYGNGIWFYLKAGFCNHTDAPCSHSTDSCWHSLHEDTVAELLTKLKHIGTCDCEACRGAKNG